MIAKRDSQGGLIRHLSILGEEMYGTSSVVSSSEPVKPDFISRGTENLMEKKVVTHLITGLGKGGAETMLYHVLKYRSDPQIEYKVVSLGGSSYYEDRIKALGFEVKTVLIRKRFISSFFKIKRFIRGSDVLCCWMYHANFIGYLVGRAEHIPTIIWNIRHSNLSTEMNKRLTLYINKWCARRSKKVSAITYNGSKARNVHEAIGYCREKGRVLVNGVDMNEYKPIANARARMCKEMGMDSQARIVLSVTRNHPIKDVPTFLKAFGEVHSHDPHTVAVMCGSGIDVSNKEILRECKQCKLTIGKDIFLLGLREDVPMLLSSCDLYVLHSAGEAFPNTLIQAMACRCVCVATDVGDVRDVLGNDTLIVKERDYYAMAEKIEYWLSASQEQRLSESGRVMGIVRSRYNIGLVVRMYEELYRMKEV